MPSSTMASFVPSPAVSEMQDRRTTAGTIIFSYTCVGLTGTALVAVLLFYCYQHFFRRRAPVSAATGAEEGNPPGPEGDHVGVDVTKLPEYAYTQSSRRRSSNGGGDGVQCSVCLGAVQPGEMVRRLPICKHLYHVECIDMWLASHVTCPVCRSDVEHAPADGQAAAPTTEPTQVLPPV
ncbi:unnamed protein product [Urochloa decumbens]|uniref:RING-type E3 ubiquitin transferase n=1 Tax=Urochloa decumbens TaxID=240449 RepID=A0ABC9DZL4_9POAL